MWNPWHLYVTAGIHCSIYHVFHHKDLVLFYEYKTSSVCAKVIIINMIVNTIIIIVNFNIIENIMIINMIINLKKYYYYYY